MSLTKQENIFFYKKCFIKNKIKKIIKRKDKEWDFAMPDNLTTERL